MGVGHEELPSIDVRCPNLRWHYNEADIAARLSIPEKWVNEVSEVVYEREVKHFWCYAGLVAEEVFGSGIEVRSEGRSGAHLCLAGLPEIFLWKKRQTAKWLKYVKCIEATLDSYTELETAAQLVADYLEIEMSEKAKS